MAWDSSWRKTVDTSIEEQKRMKNEYNTAVKNFEKPAPKSIPQAPKSDTYSFVYLLPNELEKIEERRKELEKEGVNFEVSLTPEDFADRTVSPFTFQNRYRYSVNISHPAILPYYNEFKKATHATVLSNPERWLFEDYVLKELKRLNLEYNDFSYKKETKKKYER